MDLRDNSFFVEWRKELTEDVKEIRLDVKQLVTEQGTQNSRLAVLETNQKVSRWLVGTSITLLLTGVVDFVINHLGGKH